MYQILSERPLPNKYMQLLGNLAVVIAPDRNILDVSAADLSEIHAIIASSHPHYDGSVMDRAPLLKVIARPGIGVDNISVSDATERGIAVCNTPNGPTVSTAEHTVALMLAVARRLKAVERAMRRSDKTDHFDDYDGVELYGLRLGLIGVGRIGSRVASIARALGMIVVGYDPYVTSERANELDIGFLPTLEELLPVCDVVSLHAPLTHMTHGLIDAERLRHFKRGAILINTSRGGLVSESALLHALEAGRLRGAGLDVFDPEPPSPDNPLLHRDDVVATPHIAAATAASKDRLLKTAITQVLCVLRGERPSHLVNPEVWPPSRLNAERP